MPSPAERRPVERALRAAACVALGALLWRAWRPGVDAPSTLGVVTRALPGALARATTAPLAQLDLDVDSLPGRRDRAWLRAIAAAGTPVRWHVASPGASAGTRAAAPASIATVVEPLADPSGRARVTTTAAPGRALAVHDAAGTVDSAQVAASGVRTLDATVDGVVRAASSTGSATSLARDSIVLRPVLVLGRAGWEGKFVTAALEEAGWRVDARFRVSPTAEVRQGGAAPIDTARYAAVIVLDPSAAPDAAAVARFVRSGGGAIVAHDAASLPALAPLVPAREGKAITGELGALATDTPRRALDGAALAAVHRDAVVLDRTGGEARVVAARVDAGRVVVHGYDDTWRWRMEGGDDAVAAHRAWWSSLVSSVAYAPVIARVAASAGGVQLKEAGAVDEAPFPALVDALGPASPRDATRDGRRPPLPWDALLFAIFVAALLAEWGSRRMRGRR